MNNNNISPIDQNQPKTRYKTTLSQDFFILLIFLIGILSIIYFHEKPEYMPTTETLILNELSVIDNGSIELTADAKCSISDIENLIPEENRDYQSINLLDTILDEDTIYFYTVAELIGIAKDLFSFDINTGEVSYLGNISQISLNIEDLFVINDTVYFSGYSIRDFSTKAYYIDNQELHLISSDILFNAMEYDDGLAYMTSDMTGTYISKAIENETTKFLRMSNTDAPIQIVGKKTLSWLSEETSNGETQNFFTTYINNEIKKFPFDETDGILAMQHFYLLANVSQTEFKIMNYNGEEIANITGTELLIVGSNYIDTFIYRDNHTLKTYKINIDANTNTMYTTELIHPNINSKNSHWVLDENNMLFINDYIYHNNLDTPIEYYFFTA